MICESDDCIQLAHVPPTTALKLRVSCQMKKDLPVEQNIEYLRRVLFL